MHLPVILDAPTPRPIDPVNQGAATSRDGRRQTPAEFVYRGELLEEFNNRAFRPQPNLQISAMNRRAIETYLEVDAEPAPIGRFLNGFI